MPSGQIQSVTSCREAEKLSSIMSKDSAIAEDNMDSTAEEWSADTFPESLTLDKWDSSDISDQVALSLNEFNRIKIKNEMRAQWRPLWRMIRCLSITRNQLTGEECSGVCCLVEMFEIKFDDGAGSNHKW